MLRVVQSAARLIGRRAVAAAAVSLALVSGMACAQQAQNAGFRSPNEYTQEDSDPVRGISYILSPVGTMLEYGLARPLHYLATETFLQPVLDPSRDADSWEEYYGSATDRVPLPPVPSEEQADKLDEEPLSRLSERDLGNNTKPTNPSATPDALTPAPPDAGQKDMSH